MPKFKMIFPCKVNLSEMKEVGDGAFFCNSCATHVTDVRNNVVPIQNIKCGIFNVTDIEFESIHFQTQVFQVARISVLALVGLIAMPGSSVIAQSNNIDSSLSKLRFPIVVKGQLKNYLLQPIPDAHVQLITNNPLSDNTVLSDNEGKFSLSISEKDLIVESIQLKVTGHGFPNNKFQFTVNSDTMDVSIVNIELKPVEVISYLSATSYSGVTGMITETIPPKKTKHRSEK